MQQIMRQLKKCSNEGIWMITYELAVLIGIVILIGYVVYALLLKRSMKKTILTCVFIMYLTGVAVITLFPIIIDDPVVYSDMVTWYNLIPFRTITGALQNGSTPTALTQIVGNILLAVPFGVIVPILFPVTHRWQKLLLALAFPLTIELSQFIIGLAIGNMYRNVDADDVILNTAGVYLGYGIHRLLPQSIRRVF